MRVPPLPPQERILWEAYPSVADHAVMFAFMGIAFLRATLAVRSADWLTATTLRTCMVPLLLMTLCLLMIPVGVVRGAQDGVVDGVVERGQLIFVERCAVCHGPQGRGDGPEAPFLSPRPASLISAGTSVKSDAELLAVIANGKPRTAMPAWKDQLSEEQRREVLAYIRTLIRFQPKPLTPPPPQEQR